jgi:hypothetical protein
VTRLLVEGKPARAGATGWRFSTRPAFIQAKLPVGAPDDAYEREADRMAAQATGSGRQLPDPAFFSSRLGHDIGKVRIHADERAARAARSLNARAFTLGSDVFFGVGEFLPETAAGRRLLVHELTHVAQQSTMTPCIQRARHLVYADGYPQPQHYQPEQREIQCSQGQLAGCQWSPWNLDMAALAEGSGGGTPCRTFDALLALIEAQSPGSIDELGVVGHANEEGLALAGRIVPDDVLMATNSMLGLEETLDSHTKRVEGARDRFGRNARITMFGCHTGSSMALLNRLSAAFRVCARGFTRAIRYRIAWQGNTITSRGEVASGEAEETFNSVGLQAPAMYLRDVWSLHPDMESCYGAPAETMAQIVEGASRKAVAPDAVARRILEGYFADQKLKVDAVVRDPEMRVPHWLTGGSIIAVRPRGTGQATSGVIAVGDDFREATTREAFEDRFEQIEWALRVIDEWRAGTAPRTPRRHMTSR